MKVGFNHSNTFANAVMLSTQEENRGIIYFTTDTRQLVHDGQVYSITTTDALQDDTLNKKQSEINTQLTTWYKTVAGSDPDGVRTRWNEISEFINSIGYGNALEQIIAHEEELIKELDAKHVYLTQAEYDAIVASDSVQEDVTYNIYEEE